MPVHRHLHDRMGSVYAFRTELDAWVRSRHPWSTAGERARLPRPPSTTIGEHRSPSTRPTFVLGLAAAGVALAIGAGVWLRETEFFWRSPIADAQFQRVTDFDGVEQAAAVSRDGRFVAFLSDRDGQMDVWVTQVGSGQFHNLTRGGAAELVNPSVRLLGFSPDGSFVTFWVRRPDGSQGGAIGIWAVSTLGGQPRPYLEGVAESDWSSDGARLVYHTPGPGDPMFVTDASRRSEGRRIFTAPAGLHGHFPLWAPDGRFIYFVEGSLPDQLDIWRISPDGGPAERITSHNGRVSHPVLLNRRTLVYLASDPDGSGPWLHSLDVERRIPHRLSSGVDRYTSLAASADGRRLVATVASPKRTLWRVPIGDAPAGVSTAVRISLTTGTGVLSATWSGLSSLCRSRRYEQREHLEAGGRSGDRAVDGSGSANLRRPGHHPRRAPGRVLGPAARADPVVRDAGRRHERADRRRFARAAGRSRMGAGRSIDHFRGRSIAVTPHLFRVPVDGGAPSPFVDEYSIDPAWAPDGRFVVYSGPDIGTTFSVQAVTTEAAPHPLPALT